VSGELYRALWRRTHVYLREARRLQSEGEYDVALAMAKQAAQLALKAAYSRLLGYTPRGTACAGF
jgi:HEPN domain-containing protein